ncbi:phosphodiesterase [Aliishimia ponticola]|uniref:Phosphodiesterase n=1 Tax=Aliishimia ponticola TaxID=2499833 RepID=A0A4S4NDT0_9RHOB|nr:metallophosphoesterase [Aliishimia ponticola]THH36697.1 phosphodiesterase [Aliishimia ponticola]
MTRFVHITDLHVSAPDTDDPNRQTDTVGTLDKLLDALERLDPQPDFVLASGDLTNIGDELSYRLVKSRLERVTPPVITTLGNHDKREAWHAVFPGHPAAPDGPVDRDDMVAGVHVIALDTSVPGKVSGALDDGQLATAAKTFAKHPDARKVVAIHHPPRLDPEGAVWTSLDQRSTDGLAELIRSYDVAAVLCGHVHMNRVAFWEGVPLVVTMGQQSTVDLTRSDALRVIEGTGFAICDLAPSGFQVTFVPLQDSRLIKEIPVERLIAFS